MPKIINAFSGNESVADSLKSLGESMFGNEAKNEVYRQTAKEKLRHNEAAPLAAEAFRGGNHRELGAQFIMGDRGGGDFNQYYRGSAAIGAHGNVNDPSLQTAMMSNGPYSATAAGEHESLAQKDRAQRYASDRAASTQDAIARREQQGRDDQFNRTPEQVQGPDGNIILQPRSSAMGMPAGKNVELANARTLNDMTTSRQQASERYKVDNTPTTIYDDPNRPTIVPQSEAVKNHAGAPMTKDQVVAGVIQREVNGGPQGSTTVPLGSTEPEAGPPTGYIHPLVQEALGYGKGAVPYQHMQSGAIGQSYDGGKTIDGHPAGPGWVPQTTPGAITQTRTNQQIDNAGTPLPPAPGQYPQAAVDAGKTSGGGAIIQHGANATWGLLGGGEVGADANRARENLTNLANEARAVVLSSPGRAAVQAQKWANASIPQPGALGMTGANADQQKNAVITFTQHLRQLYQTEAAEAQDRTTPPAERDKLLVHMAQLKRIIGSYEAPPQAGGPQAPGGPQQGAPAAGKVVIQNGWRYQPDGTPIGPAQ